MTPEHLHELLRYEPATGKLFWKERSNRSFNTRFAGKEALTADDGKGYPSGTIEGKVVRAHRIIFAMMTGRWPIEVDHRNGERSDNRWCNLREVTHRENALNRKQSSANTSGATGVYAYGEKWRAQIGNSRTGAAYLGTFDTKQKAIAARRKAERAHGYHHNHGRKAK